MSVVGNGMLAKQAINKNTVAKEEKLGNRKFMAYHIEARRGMRDGICLCVNHIIMEKTKQNK